MTSPDSKFVNKGDTAASLVLSVSYEDPLETLSINPDSVSFYMWPVGTYETDKASSMVVDGGSATVNSNTGGIIELQYDFEAGDIDTLGAYWGEFKFDVDGSGLTAPTIGKVYIVVI